MAAWHPGSQQWNKAFTSIKDDYCTVLQDNQTYPSASGNFPQLNCCDIAYLKSVQSSNEVYEDCDRDPELEALIFASDDDSNDSMQIPPSSPFPRLVCSRKRTCPENDSSPVIPKRRKFGCKLVEQFERIQMEMMKKKCDDTKMNFDPVFLKLVAHYTSSGKPVPPKILQELNK